jgi:hypothetical protein
VVIVLWRLNNMPRYQITDNKTGKTVVVEGSKPPTEVDAEKIFTDAGLRQEKKTNPVLEFFLGGAKRTFEDIGTGIAQRQSGATESQQAALDMQAKLNAMSRNADPEAQRRMQSVSNDITRTVGQGSRQMAGEFSEDIKVNPLLRGLETGVDVAGTAATASQLLNMAAKAPEAIKGGVKAVKNIPKELNFVEKWANARDLAAKKYANVDIGNARKAILEKIANHLKVDPSKAAELKAKDILQSLDNTQDVSGLLERTKFWNDAYKASGGVKTGAENKLFDIAAKTAKEFIKKEAPEVAKYTNKMRLYYQVPKTASKWIWRGALASMGVNQAKSILGIGR